MKINYNGIKGRSGDYDLGTACLVLGENATGKSALIMAIHFALTGKLAGMRMGKGGTQDPGRLLKAICDGGYAEIDFMDVVLRRRLEATAKKAKILTICNDEEGPAAELAAKDLEGDLLFADFRRLVAAGDKERADVLATYLPQPDDQEKRKWAVATSVSGILAALKPAPKRGQRKVEEPVSCVARQKNRYAELLALAEGHGASQILNQIRTVWGTAGDSTTEEYIEQIRLAANAADEARKTGVKVAEEAARAGTDDAALATDIPALEALVNQLRATKVHAQSWAEAALSKERQESVLNRLIADIQGDMNTLKTKVTELAGADKQLAKAKEELEQVEQQKPADSQASDARMIEQQAQPLRAAIAQAQLAEEQLQTIVAQVLATQHEIERQIENTPIAPIGNPVDIAQAMGQRTLDLSALKSLGASIKAQWELAKKGICPVTQGACTIDLGKVAVELADRLTDLAKRVRAAQVEEAHLAAQLRAAQAETDAYQSKLHAWKIGQNISANELQHLQIRGRALKQTAASLPGLREKLVPLERELNLLHAAQAQYVVQHGVWAENVKAAERTVAELTQRCYVSQSMTERLGTLKQDLARASENLAHLQAETCPTQPEAFDLVALDEAETKLSAAHAARARTEVLQNIDVDALTLEASLWKAAYRGAATGLMACVQAATDPIVSKISAGLKAMGIAGDFYVDLEARSFGVLRDGTLIDVEVLSGGEAVLFAAAMLAALPAKGSPRVLTLEGAELSASWLTRLLEGLDCAAFDAVIVATCQEPATIPKHWTVVRMEGGKSCQT